MNSRSIQIIHDYICKGDTQRVISERYNVKQSDVSKIIRSNNFNKKGTSGYSKGSSSGKYPNCTLVDVSNFMEGFPNKWHSFDDYIATSGVRNQKPTTNNSINPRNESRVHDQRIKNPSNETQFTSEFFSRIPRGKILTGVLILFLLFMFRSAIFELLKPVFLIVITVGVIYLGFKTVKKIFSGEVSIFKVIVGTLFIWVGYEIFKLDMTLPGIIGILSGVFIIKLWK